jgi:hypothetical protein
MNSNWSSEALVETIKMDIWNTWFEARMRKLWYFEETPGCKNEGFSLGNWRVGFHRSDLNLIRDFHHIWLEFFDSWKGLYPAACVCLYIYIHTYAIHHPKQRTHWSITCTSQPVNPPSQGCARRVRPTESPVGGSPCALTRDDRPRVSRPIPCELTNIAWLNHFAGHSIILDVALANFQFRPVVLLHSCYSAQPFLLQGSVILVNSVIPHCYSIQPFSIELQYLAIHSATLLTHFSLSNNAQPFYWTELFLMLHCSAIFHWATVFNHMQMATANSVIFCYNA